MFGKRQKKGNMFAVKRTIVQCEPEPEPEPEEEYDDTASIVIRQPKRAKNRLPGEKLLRDLHRQRLRSRIEERLAQMKISPTSSS